MGRYYEEFEIGACYETPRRTILDADIVQFAGLTADYNPLHTDDIFASQSDFGGRIAHGPMLVGMAFGLASRVGLLDGTALALLNIAWTFTGPARRHDSRESARRREEAGTQIGSRRRGPATGHRQPTR